MTATTAEIAAELDTTPRTLRRFLRATMTDTPGKGSRYALPSDKRSIAALAKKFAKWEEADKAAKSDSPDASTE